MLGNVNIVPGVIYKYSRDHVCHQLCCRAHCRLEETDDYGVETVLQSRISPECLLKQEFNARYISKWISKLAILVRI